MSDRVMQMAMHCGTPLISTPAFSGAEFYCRKCGSTLGMFDPVGKDTTPELEAESEENSKWFQEIMDDHIPYNCKFGDCEECSKEGSTYHHVHATPEQLEKSQAALKKLQESVGK